MNCMVRENAGVKHFRTCEELLPTLPEVFKLREIFNLFERTNGSNTIDILNVSECLHAMGLHFVESRLKSCIVERLLKFPQAKPPTNISFELVLTIYCELARLEEMPSTDVLVNGLRWCDTNSTGMLPYDQLRHMLTTLGDCLNEVEASDLLDNMKDDSGNINYVTLLKTLFFNDVDGDIKLHQVHLYLEALGQNASFMDMRKRDQFIRTLRKMDTKNTGHISAERLLKVLNAGGDRFTISELAALTQGMLNSKKYVDYRKFLRLIMNE